MQTFGREPGNLLPALFLAVAMFFIARAVLPEKMLAVPQAQAENGAVAGIGQTVANGYPFDRQVAAFRGAASAADTLTNAGILATPEFAIGGRQNLAVSVRHATAAATQKIRVLLIWKVGSTNYPLTLTDEVTFTANANNIPDPDGNYYSQPYVFCTFGASHARIIRSAASSSGNNTIWAGSF